MENGIDTKEPTISDVARQSDELPIEAVQELEFDADIPSINGVETGAEALYEDSTQVQKDLGETAVKEASAEVDSPQYEHAPEGQVSLTTFARQNRVDRKRILAICEELEIEPSKHLFGTRPGASLSPSQQARILERAEFISEDAPEEVLSTIQAARSLNVDKRTLENVAERLGIDLGTYRFGTRYANGVTPKQLEVIAQESEFQSVADSEGIVTVRSFARDYHLNPRSIPKAAAELGIEIKDMRVGRRFAPALTPDQQTQLLEVLGADKPPEGVISLSRFAEQNALQQGDARALLQELGIEPGTFRFKNRRAPGLTPAQQQLVLERVETETAEPPEGFETLSAFCQEHGMNYEKAKAVLSANGMDVEAYNFGGKRSKSLAVSTEGQALLRSEMIFDSPPEGYLSRDAFGHESGISYKRIASAIKDLGLDLQKYRFGVQATVGLSPEDQTAIVEHFSGRAPTLKIPTDELLKSDEWRTVTSLAKALGVSNSVIATRILQFRGTNPEWFEARKDKSNRHNEHLHPTLVKMIATDLAQYEAAPEGYMTLHQMRKLTGAEPRTLKRILEQAEVEGYVLKSPSGHTRTYYPPSALEIVTDEHLKFEEAPEGALTVLEFANQLGVKFATLKRLMGSIEEEHPELFGRHKNSNGRPVEYCYPEAIELISTQYGNVEPVPTEDGWASWVTLSKELGHSMTNLRRIAEPLMETNPELFKVFKNAMNRNAEFCHPSVRDFISDQLSKYEEAPEGWSTIHAIATKLGVNYKVVNRMLAGLEEETDDQARLYKATTGHVLTHYSPDMVSTLETTIIEDFKGREPVPEGWFSNNALAKRFGRGQATIESIASLYRESNPEWFQEYYNRNGVFEHLSPELIKEIEVVLAIDQMADFERAEQDTVKKSLVEFVSGIEKGEALEAQDFRGLIELFGAEQAVDILYSYHPEYRKVPVPFVKSILADYLGEFMFLPGDLQLDKLEISLDLLSDQSLKDRLVEIVKQDCLKFYNQMSRIHDGEVDISILGSYIEHLREQTAEYANTDLVDVLNEVESYYQSLLEGFSKPDSLLDEISEGRPFPDLNQRINVREIELKQKMLIADEMGVGKSASAILAKETLGVRQALVVAPSNVIDVWLNYLSDTVDEDGHPIGYFKNGQAPSVLVIEDPDALNITDVSTYDYVLLSQERLTAKYMPGLEKLDFDMLIVDEVHKLKNVVNGKRAENLLELASQINGGSQYLTLLSGTPVPNKVSDVAMLLKLLYPEQFSNTPNNVLTNQILKGDVLDLRSLLVPRMQMKSLADSVEMPALDEKLHVTELSDKEREIYNVLLDEDEFTATEKLQVLRKFVLNPRLFDATPEIVGAKAQDVGDELRKAFVDKDKVVMFVNGYIEGVIRGNDTIIQDLNVPEGVDILTIDGKVDKKRRLAIQDELHQAGKKLLLIVSGQTADVGVDFSAADELMFYNEPWTEYDKLQQRGRVYRFGLEGDLKSHTNYVKGTIEEGIHQYIKSKHQAVEKLLRGVPLSEIERELLKRNEEQADPNLEVDPALAEYYFSSWERMLKIYNFVKQRGEDDFVKFLDKHGKEYADSYTTMGSRSYQANVSRLAGTVIDKQVKSRRQKPQNLRILDVAAGPEVLKRHISEPYQSQVVSLDINEHHFADGKEGKKVVGSFVNLPVADDSVDYANLALSLHYSSFLPSRQQFERVEVLRELNRVLTVGGRAVVSLMHSLDLKDEAAFYGAVQKLGFKVVNDYTGVVESGTNFKTRLITLEKAENGPSTTKEAVKVMGKGLLNGLKFAKTDVKLRDSRKIVTSFNLGNKKIKAQMNTADQRVLDEERSITGEMTKLKNRYKNVKDIPVEEIQRSGFSRIFNTRSYLLFKQLQDGDGAVIVR